MNYFVTVGQNVAARNNAQQYILNKLLIDWNGVLVNDAEHVYRQVQETVAEGEARFPKCKPLRVTTYGFGGKPADTIWVGEGHNDVTLFSVKFAHVTAYKRITGDAVLNDEDYFLNYSY